MFELLNLYNRLGPLLKPAGMLYGGIMRFRRGAYRRKSRQTYRPACPTITVGNISWGGTGKTPITAWLLSWAQQQGLKAGVLSRGYKGRPGVLPLLVTAATAPTASGDEPLMLAKAFPAAKVLVDPKRARAARYAEAHFDLDLLIADDAFQHLALERDYNIVLLTLDDLSSEWNRVIPAGSWREDASALQDAQVILLRLPSPLREQDLQDLFRLAGQKLGAGRENGCAVPFFPFCYRPIGLRRLGNCGSGNAVAVPDLSGRQYVLFCGVGAPQGVLESASSFLGYAPLKFVPFADHYHYTREDLLELAGAGIALVCTGKDAVKLEAELPELVNAYPIWAIQMQIEFLEGRDTQGNPAVFPEFWERAWRDISTARSERKSRL